MSIFMDIKLISSCGGIAANEIQGIVEAVRESLINPCKATIDLAIAELQLLPQSAAKEVYRVAKEAADSRINRDATRCEKNEKIPEWNGLRCQSYSGCLQHA